MLEASHPAVGSGRRTVIRYLLSRIIPVPMVSDYLVLTPAGTIAERERSTWWQWRDRVWGTRTVRTPT